MRGLVIVSLLLLVLLALLILCFWYISDSATRIVGELDGMERLLADENWTEAMARYDKAKQCWESTHPTWQTMINHDDMRDIEIAFVDLDTAISQQDAEEANRELAGLRFYLQHVPDTERVSWGNIL